MGELSRQSAGPARERLAAALKRAHADEWHAHYNFNYLAGTLAGYRAPSVITLLNRLSAEALERADALGRRLCELGGEPAGHLKDLASAASDKPFRRPDDPTDVDGALRAVLDAVRTGFRAYDALVKDAGGADPVTAGLAARFLAVAARDEETLERLLGQRVPGLDGTARG